MKKNKLVGLAALLLALGMAGCGEKEGGEQAGPCDKHTYADWVETKAATCTEKGSKERVCSVCGEKETAEIKVKSHSYEKVDAESSASTCTVKGKEVKKCSVCGNKTEKELDLADHTWADYTPDASDTEHEVVAATCEVPGKHFQKCSVCNTIQEVTDNALGHVYAKAENSDDDLVTWTKEVSCEEDGVGTKTCTRTGCGHIENVTATKLGHDMKLPEGEIIKPTDGTATVRMYSCAHEGCNKTELGFAADEVTAASKERLVVESDGGTRFWGRPIGNAVPLNDKGDPSSDNHPSIFDKKETGDFFEYKFNLTSEQATKLANAKLYCDAKPASYLSGKDFWANKSGDEDWTRGRYIDDNPDHLEAEEGTRIKYDQEGQKVINAETQEVETETGVIGKEITDYRYILYVDGGVGHENELVPVEFDKTVSVPVQGRAGSETRMEYVMPYTFHLHAGVNTISLRMAGGYRSLFYNFIFRAVEEEPAQEQKKVAEVTQTVNTADEKVLSWNPYDYNNADCKNHTGKASDTEVTNKIFKFNAQKNENYSEDLRSYVTYYINSPEAANNAYLEFEAARSGGPDSWFGKTNTSQDNTATKINGEYPDYRYIVRINDEVIPFVDKGPEMSGTKAWVKWTLKDFAIKAGENKIQIEALAGYAASITGWRVTLHNHNLESSLQKTNADSKTVKLEKCAADSFSRISIAFTDGNVTGNINSGKMEKGTTSTWKINVDKAISGAKLVFAMKCSSQDHENRHLYNEYKYDEAHKTEEGYVSQNTGGTPDKSTEDDWRYTVTVNGTEAPISNMKTVKENGITNGNTGYMEFAVIDLVAGENTISLKQNNIGYRWVFQNDVRIEFVGDAVIVDAAA